MAFISICELALIGFIWFLKPYQVDYQRNVNFLLPHVTLKSFLRLTNS